MTGKTVAAQIRQAARHLGYAADGWRVREAWYGRAGRWVGAALREMQERFTAWRDREAAAAAGPSSLTQRVAAMRRLLIELERQVAGLEAEVAGLGVGGKSGEVAT